MLIGSARHGKDTVAELLKKNLGYCYVSPTYYAAKTFIFDQLKNELGYKTVDECVEDRINHRVYWKEIIKKYNSNDPARLIREVYQQGDIYIGCRDLKEFYAAKEESLFDLAVWVDRSHHIPREDYSSNQLEMIDADVIIDNNYDLVHLEKQIDKINQMYRLVY